MSENKEIEERDYFKLYNPEVEKEWEMPEFELVTGDLYKTKYNWFVTCPANLYLGINTDIGIFTYINARYGVRIEDNVSIGSHCAIYSHDSERDIKGEIIIKKEILIGSHVVILPRKYAHLISKNVKAGSVVY